MYVAVGYILEFVDSR